MLYQLLIAILLSTVQSIPMKDLSDQSFDFGRAFASKYSVNNQVVVVYFGSDQELMKKVQQGLSEARSEGVKITGLVIQKANPLYNEGQDSYVFYYNGYCTCHHGSRPINANHYTVRMAKECALAFLD